MTTQLHAHACLHSLSWRNRRLDLSDGTGWISIDRAKRWEAITEGISKTRRRDFLHELPLQQCGHLCLSKLLRSPTNENYFSSNRLAQLYLRARTPGGRLAHGLATFVLKAIGLFSTLLLMSGGFSIEVAKDYFNFASAHFLIFADGRREPLHGHNYQVSVAMEGELDRAGVVLDFITFKPLVKGVCDALDHRTLIQADSSTIEVRKRAKEVEILYKKQRLVLPRRDVILLPIANTSTELLAEYIAGQIKRKVRQNFSATIRYMEVAVEEARGQKGIFRSDF